MEKITDNQISEKNGKGIVDYYSGRFDFGLYGHIVEWAATLFLHRLNIPRRIMLEMLNGLISSLELWWRRCSL